MKRRIATIAIIIFSINCHSQIEFEKGYFIDNDNKQTECYIKNAEWGNNPTMFKYKISADSPVELATIDSVKEFGISNTAKYVRAFVDIDRSVFENSSLGYSSNPVFKREKLFLNVLVEGKANLYKYRDGNIIRFFFNTDSTPIEQLVYLPFLVREYQVAYNTKYRGQLGNELKCECITQKELDNVDYNLKDLTQIFVKYNTCVNSDYMSYEHNWKKSRKKSFSLSLRPGLNISHLYINSDDKENNVDFGTTYRMRFGIEAEFTLPFNKGKWALIVEPTYQSLVVNETFGFRNFNVEYKSLQFPVGIRHYFFLNDKSKVFVNMSRTFEFTGKSSITIDSWDYDYYLRNYDIFTDRYIWGLWNFGAGYCYNEKYSIEFRLHNKYNLLSSTSSYTDAPIETFSVILGYKVF